MRGPIHLRFLVTVHLVLWAAMAFCLAPAAHAQLLADEAAFEKLVRHMETIGEISKTLAAKVSVFGAPGNRKRGALSLLEARTIGLPRMRILGDVAAKYDYLIGIESVPEYYKCDFLDRVDDVAQFVSECGHEKVVTHFDIACITLGGDNPVDKLDRLLKIAHFHASEPDLAGFAEPKCDHPSVAAKLKTIGYENWVVIEMRQIGTDLEALETALDYVSRTYGFN